MVERGGGVVVQAGGAALEEGSDDDELVLADDGGERGGRGAGDGLGEVEESVVLALAEVLRAEELRQADEPGTVLGGLAHAGHGLGEIGLGGRLAGHLDKGDAGGGHRILPLCGRQKALG